MKRIIATLIILLSLFLVFGGSKASEVENYEENGILLRKEGGNLKIVSKSNILGLKLEMTKENISKFYFDNNVFKIEKENTIFLAKRNGFIVGEEVGEYEGEIEDLLISEIVTKIDYKKEVQAKTRKVKKEISQYGLLGDYNKDKIIDMLDFNTLKANFGTTNSAIDIGPAEKGSEKWEDIYCIRLSDGIVNIKDLVVFVNNLGKTIPKVIEYEIIENESEVIIKSLENKDVESELIPGEIPLTKNTLQLESKEKNYYIDLKFEEIPSYILYKAENSEVYGYALFENLENGVVRIYVEGNSKVEIIPIKK